MAKNPILEAIESSIDPDALLNSPEYRRELCRMSPLHFAYVYLPHHISDAKSGVISFSEVHAEWAELAKLWAKAGSRAPAEDRHAFIAPRKLGKSTWWYLILPVWWAAYGYSKFTVAFANGAQQAELHLKTFRNELDTNERLREDFPELCRKKYNPRGTSEGDSHDMRHCGNGFVFIAKGIDAGSLGMKVGALRPDTILLDDIEPDEANYSPYMKDQRLKTVQDAVLPLDDRARVVLSGTTTMYGSIVHDLVRHAQGFAQDWVTEEKFKVHHHKPFVLDAEGNERSIWQDNPSFAWDVMDAKRDQRAFKKNFENDPATVDSEYWKPSDFTRGEFAVGRTVLSIDGAVTVGKRSDYTGVAIVGCADATFHEDGSPAHPRRCLVKFAHQVKKQGAELRQYVLDLIMLYPEITHVLVETNQGGDMWKTTLHDLPPHIKFVTIHNSVKKEVRASDLLNLYQEKPTRVVHTEPHHLLETQMIQFPAAPHDDMLDATGNAVLAWLKPTKRIRAGIQVQYPT
ncbi:hypothetical protein ACFUN8_18515 [Streptomyces sp. NPDC057307]|uniref:hypothetical protein n=1 Tax=Streptomyces sp. NPDC057307 TaxID=3346096 RepID=UPI003630EDC5